MDTLLKNLHSPEYTWESETLKGRGNKLYLIGKPIK